MNIIDGKQIAQNLRNDIAQQVKKLDRAPGLAVILVGDDPASAVYVRNKDNACKEVGFYSEKINKPADITQKELLDEVERLNNDDKIDGILVQLPLPKHLDANLVIETISPEKDVDGFHSENIGKLMQNKPYLRPCTPKGVMTMLATTGIDLVGKDCVVVGASNIVGRPMAMELLNARATVTICNSRTTNLSTKLQQADVIVAAVGIPQMIQGDWVKPGAVVIDVGINRLDSGKLVGDVDFDSATANAAWMTPVPGGVGPMTIATLLENTLTAYQNRK
ncbi:MAG: bifunctional methylenetetrahydrofolate dehydrogenase/methenyltetrahydrofolate cyclohydrolase FolD [Candidatus Thioglobus sp.]|jgi:methylenetetrahydrofolate dehydrogenase (NADP+)/methenyltetrahydrofolate cyclohydrolase|uniref:bifunctional methylenetetrahydrofolate dehydrogenase/methenyltetrahydrofolate cyclohydrolase FolD n=2 Tax=Candidatus Thioglobus TaxID=655184 RepID=UPI001D7A50FF|nr:bifunctional methylenetetrahydrofolate dehydrogenase/methenyltetrahydrofolate cyclohydrolase FolD [Candidatus Thioglobus sp.]MBT3277025.1 bifunctional methylenetetrahydrofolate dehydrogenase/methenyltetrahydrofolate cyclohydrolase FolD [Candidatus Thioglobus sp.]MBT3447200.1 bifunctional methylenetetrahydrofolate dehydrogenase/methenyltetrahydrofolate cyclohydrolase FolD [Candidatus Thioglobus sp.]MBT3744927.1 bifunctional methylenetetrahydrofolate dehydrogenase/methenyltetrahydrofolate cyclo